MPDLYVATAFSLSAKTASTTFAISASSDTCASPFVATMSRGKAPVAQTSGNTCSFAAVTLSSPALTSWTNSATCAGVTFDPASEPPLSFT